MEGKNLSYLAFVLVLSVLALAALAVETTIPVSHGTRQILAYGDTAFCALFFIDFLVMVYRAESRWKYLATWGWLDLLSCVPSVAALRWGRAARMVRVFRVLRGMRSARVLTQFILQRRAESAFLAVTLVSVTLVAVSAISILNFEADAVGSNIKTAEDAAWWAVATITTAGYGDRYPVTSEGRAVATILMVAGVGLFGTLSGFVAAWFLAPGRANQEAELGLLRREIADLNAALLEMAGTPGKSLGDR